MGVKENLQLMKTLDDSWNAGPGSPLWETFRKRHREDVAVYWPAQPDPTRGRHNHDVEAIEFFKTFDNRLVNNPYKIAFGQGDHTCTVADWTVTMKGPMKNPEGKTILPTGKTASLNSAQSPPGEQRNSRRKTILRCCQYDEAAWTEQIVIPTSPEARF